MQGAYTGESNGTDQGHNPPQPPMASRFNDLNSRNTTIPATGIHRIAVELIGAIKRKEFSISDLQYVAFAMDAQVYPGKDTPALVAQINDLQQQVIQMTHRAEMAEASLLAMKTEAAKGQSE